MGAWNRRGLPSAARRWHSWFIAVLLEPKTNKPDFSYSTDWWVGLPKGPSVTEMLLKTVFVFFTIDWFELPTASTDNVRIALLFSSALQQPFLRFVSEFVLLLCFNYWFCRFLHSYSFGNCNRFLRVKVSFFWVFESGCAWVHAGGVRIHDDVGVQLIMKSPADSNF